MLATALSCPHCQATMKSNKPVPLGTRLKCPKCATAFVAGEPPKLPLAPTANGLAAPSLPVPDISQPKSNRGLIMVLVGTAAFVFVGGLLLFLCLRGGTPNVATDPEVPPQAGGIPDILEPKSFVKPAQPLIVLTPEEEKKVQEATRKGVEFLRKFQSPDGTWDYVTAKKAASAVHRPGATALAALTLLESGVPKDDPGIVKAAKYLRKSVAMEKATYDLALCILFFDKLADPGDKQHIHTMGLRLIAGQNAGGGWTYSCPILSKADNDELASILRRLSTAKRNAVAETRNSLAAGTKKFKALPILANLQKGDDAFKLVGGDNSNTQFALIGLWAARRHDVPADASLALVGKRFRATQNKDGSFPYATVGAGKPSMTCAGLLGLAVSYGVKEKGTAPPPLKDAAVKHALKNLGTHVDPLVKKKAKGAVGSLPAQYLYYLWSVERVAVLYQLKEIEGKKWYHWGMELLLAHQKGDGHWGAGAVDEEGTSLSNTCFALLFLQRINLVGDLTDKLREFEQAFGAGPAMPFRDDDDP